jgi:hypothetical protein
MNPNEVVDYLTPLIGRKRVQFMVQTLGGGLIGNQTGTDTYGVLATVRAMDDGSVFLETDKGGALLDPATVTAVSWRNLDAGSSGAYL